MTSPMSTAIVDYGSGNLRSAEKAFGRMAAEAGGGPVVVTADPGVIARAERIVLPGVGAYAACRAGLMEIPGLLDAIFGRVRDGYPFLGICVGMQLMATRGLEHEETPGFDWIGGDVVRLSPADPTLKVPHMGWNELVIGRAHPVLEGITTGDHAYFVHSYHLSPRDEADRLAHVDYGERVSAVVGRGNVVGTQFHPEKSQATGLRLIANFLRWRP
jgi:imidazole glycerol-phosphate synthase subunit HisH